MLRLGGLKPGHLYTVNISLRLAAGLTQAQLAEAVGCSEHAINRWENGQFAPKGQNLLKLADALKCDPLKLL